MRRRRPRCWGATIALPFSPVQRRLTARLGHRRTLAALVTPAIAVLVVVIAFARISAALASECMLVCETSIPTNEPERVRALSTSSRSVDVGSTAYRRCRHSGLSSMD